MATRPTQLRRTNTRALATGVTGVVASCGLIASCGVDYPPVPFNPASADGGTGVPPASTTSPPGAATGAAAPGGTDGATAPPAAGSTSDGGGGSPPAANSCDVIKSQSRAILQTNCGGCHEAPNKQGNFDFILDIAHLESAGLVVPGSPEMSRIYARIVAGEMPPQGQTQRPSNGDIATLYQWIKLCVPGASDAGGGGASAADAAAGSGGSPGAVPFIDGLAISRWVAADVATLPIVDQKFQRYLSLAHLLNAGATSADMDLYRFAQAKAVNALSLGTRVAVPRAIDQYQTVFRIDLRDLGWDTPFGTSADRWELLVASNPFAIEFVDDSATVAKNLTGTKVPVQAGNWVAFGGTQPPLYYDLVNIGTTLTDLQRQLGTNIAQDIARQQVWRSGFNDSGIAQLNRVIERHDIPSGGNRSLWISYDFAGTGATKNIFAHPLDFQNDASEIIFNLPNGMEGYMLVDGAGNRLNEANNHVVTDPSQKDGNVINGISCIGCHDGGIKFKKDEVRPFVDSSFNFDANTKSIVDAIYSTPDVFQTEVSQDSSIFLGSVHQLTPPPTVTSEPVSSVFHRFEADVDLTTAAAELGITRDQLLTQLGRLDPSLAPLATGTVHRDAFTAVFAQTVCLLKIGLANDPACN